MSPHVSSAGTVLDPGRCAAFAARLADVRARLAAAARRSGRPPHAVTLVAVSKTFPTATVRLARAAGQVDFGESRAQELRRRFADADDPDGPAPLGARWHFVGRLQRNKVSGLVGRVALIHSVDRLALAGDIGAAALAAGQVQRVLVQVNVGDDPAKGGVHARAALRLVGDIRRIAGVACQGLMTIPPLATDPRPVFAELRSLRDQIGERFPEVQHLSMGMSRDYEVAIEEGATIVRLGEAVFGPREPQS